MIDIHDLCIGNWVYDGECTQFPMLVVGIGKDYVYLDFPQNEGDLWESKPEDLQGIPLTEEQIEELGFFRIEDVEGFRRYKKEIKVSKDREIAVVCTLSGGCDVFISDRIKIDKSSGVIKYHETIGVVFLHELQNFTYLTTKQELKINL